LAAGGTIGTLIPPSVGFIFYGILTRQSIGRLFMAGILPGVFQVTVYIVLIYILCLTNTKMGPAGLKTTFKQKIISFKNTWPVIFLFMLVLGGIYMGFFTPSESAAVGALGAFLIGFSMRRLSRQGIVSAFLETGRITAMVGILLVGALTFSRFMAISQMPFTLANFVSGLGLNRYIVLVMILVFYILAGCFMDIISTILLTLPIIYPVITALGFDPIWYGVLMVKQMELGCITPPFGITCFVLSSVTQVPLGTVFRGVLPFIISDFIQIAILIAIPGISLWIPNTMKG
jgi:tripartite ATP-independent transporter DctM subunit